MRLTYGCIWRWCEVASSMNWRRERSSSVGLLVRKRSMSLGLRVPRARFKVTRKRAKGQLNAPTWLMSSSVKSSKVCSVGRTGG